MEIYTSIETIVTGMLMAWFKSSKLSRKDFNVLKQIYNDPNVQNRGHNDYRKCGMANKISIDRGTNPGPLAGVIMSQGKAWTEQRRTALKVLRDFGFGKSTMEEMIQDEVKQFIAYLKQTSCTPIDIAGKFNLPILNALWKITVGESFEYSDPKLIEILEKLTELLQKFAKPTGVFAIVYPWLFKIFPNLFQRQLDIEVNQAIANLMRNSIEQHKKTLDVNSPRDVIDTMLIEIQNTTDKESSFYQDVGYNHLVNTLIDLFIAGSETTSTTLTWAVLYMVREPDIQRKVQTELDTVVGGSRLPSLADRPNLPYTEAVLMEIQRCANIVPNGLHHMSNKPVHVNGMIIPANTMISPCFTEILKGDYWGDGMVFRPERFLDESGAVKYDEHFIPFSIGKRRCLGETLAKAELFLFFASIVQQFHLQPEISGKLPTEDCITGITVLPKPFKVICKPRSLT